MKKKPALAAVGYMGDDDLVHYSIQDERGRYWTGRGFAKDKRKALAYTDEPVILQDMRRILKRCCKGVTRYRFVAPVFIDVYTEGPIDQKEMASFFSENVFVSMVGLGTPRFAWISCLRSICGTARRTGLTSVTYPVPVTLSGSLVNPDLRSPRAWLPSSPDKSWKPT